MSVLRVPQQDFREMLEGAVDELHLPIDVAPAIGSIQTIASDGSDATLDARVVDSWAHRGGGQMIRFEIAVERRTRRRVDRLALTRDQRAALLAGDYKPLTFTFEPPCKRGDAYVLSWSPERRFWDEAASRVVRIPRARRLWIEITTITRTVTGWTVRFNVHDRRDPARLLRRVPPRYGPQADEELTKQEKERAAEESAYCSDVRAAVDDELEAVPRKYAPKNLAELHRHQKTALESAQRARLSLGGQLDSLLEHAHAQSIDVRDRERRIRRELELLERDLAGRAA